MASSSPSFARTDFSISTRQDSAAVQDHIVNGSLTPVFDNYNLKHFRCQQFISYVEARDASADDEHISSDILIQGRIGCIDRVGS